MTSIRTLLGDYRGGIMDSDKMPVYLTKKETECLTDVLSSAQTARNIKDMRDLGALVATATPKPVAEYVNPLIPQTEFVTKDQSCSDTKPSKDASIVAPEIHGSYNTITVNQPSKLWESARQLLTKVFGQ